MWRKVAASLADWLEAYSPPAPNVFGDDSASSRGIAKSLAGQMRKAARRKRAGEEFIFKLDREQAAWLRAVLDGRRLAGEPLPRLVRLGSSFLGEALLSRPGRPIGTREERVSGVAGRRAVEERHRKRLKALVRREDEIGSWFDRLTGRGETILTSSEPWPGKKA